MNQAPTPSTQQQSNLPPLKLRAQDATDLSVISTFLQDALIPLVGMHYDINTRSFSLFGHRFCWEKKPRVQENQTFYQRVYSFLHFNQVNTIKTQGISAAKNPNDTLNLLSITSEDPTHILLTFSGGKKILLTVSQIAAHLHDTDTNWPTSVKPQHEENKNP